MASVSKNMITQVEIKSSADKFFELFTTKSYLLPEISPNIIVNGDLLEGDGKTVGSVKFWKFPRSSDGIQRFNKEVVEALDEENMIIKLKVVEGYLLDLYPAFATTIQVETKGSSNLVTWTFDYEKLNENIEDPSAVMGFCVALTKDIENHHLKSSD